MDDSATRPTDEPDPIDEAASEIDPRSPEAVDEIEDLIESAEELGRNPDQVVDPDADPR